MCPAGQPFPPPMQSYHPPHAFTYQPPPAYYPPPPPSGAYNPYPPHRPSTPPQPSYGDVAQKYVRNQQVSVQISANLWVVGIIVGILKAANKVFGFEYQIKYESPETGKPILGNFLPSQIQGFQHQHH